MLEASSAELSAKPSRCVRKCGQRDGPQTADVDGELPMCHAGAVSSGGRPAVAAAGVSRHASVGCARGVDGANSCWGTHAARANSWSTLHSACINSGGHVNSYGCTYSG